MSVPYLTIASATTSEDQPPPPRIPNHPGDHSPFDILPASAQELAVVMDIPAADILQADLMGSDPQGVGLSNAGLGVWFPTGGITFALLSSGRTADASLQTRVT